MNREEMVAAYAKIQAGPQDPNALGFIRESATHIAVIQAEIASRILVGKKPLLVHYFYDRANSFINSSRQYFDDSTGETIQGEYDLVKTAVANNPSAINREQFPHFAKVLGMGGIRPEEVYRRLRQLSITSLSQISSELVPGLQDNKKVRLSKLLEEEANSFASYDPSYVQNLARATRLLFANERRKKDAKYNQAIPKTLGLAAIVLANYNWQNHAVLRGIFQLGDNQPLGKTKFADPDLTMFDQMPINAVERSGDYSSPNVAVLIKLIQDIAEVV